MPASQVGFSRCRRTGLVAPMLDWKWPMMSVFWFSVCVCVCVCVCLHACVYDWTILKLYPVESSVRKIQSSPKYAYQLASSSHKCSTFCDLAGQDLSDVLLYASHPDHQLKGLTALAVGCLIQAILVEGRGDFSCWFRLHSAPENGMLSLTFMVDCFVLIDQNKCVTDYRPKQVCHGLT